MERALRVRVSGPLAGYAPELISYLADRGNGDRSTADHVGCLAHLSEWLDGRRLHSADVDETVIEQLVEALHRAGKAKKLKPGSFRVVVEFLRGRGIVPWPEILPPTPIEELLADYRRYLLAERSLAPLTVPSYLASAAWFLSEACGDDPDGIAGLSVGDSGSSSTSPTARPANHHASSTSLTWTPL